MENVIGRFRNTLNLIVLMAVLLAQVIGLAIQVKKPSETGGTRLIRVWTIAIVTPITRTFVHTGDWFSNTWHNYIWLRGVRQENEQLKDEIAQMKMQEIRLVEDAGQAHRLQVLMGFKEQHITETVPAQVISTTGTEFSRAIYIDKGSNDGIKTDMPVVTPDGIVGKVLRAFSTTSLVLLINDPTSGAGVILEKSRLQGILKGNVNGTTVMHNVMTDERVEVGDRVVTSGGDRVFPKGLPVGIVSAVTPGQDLFLNIRVKPAAKLNKIEEVLVITKMEDRTPEALPDTKRAIDILAQRLPTVAPPPPAATTEPTKPGTNASAAAGKPAPELTKPPAGAISATAGGVKPKTTQTAVTGGTLKPKAPDATTGDKPKPVKQAQTAPAITAEKPKDAQPQ